MTDSSADGRDAQQIYGVVRIDGDEAALELAGSLLFDRGCLGTEERGPSGLVAYFAADTDVATVVEALSREVPACRARAAPPLPSRDWLREWKESLSGFPLGESFYVLPTWCEIPPDIDRTILRIDPEQAFGTGTHETTRLCVELLERYVAPGIEVLDIGTGTGILAMVASRVGASRVLGIEPDPAACDCARANVERNGLEDRIRIVCAAWGTPEAEAPGAELAVANITSGVLERVLVDLTTPTIVLSGILEEERESFVDSLPARYRPVEVRVAGEWAAVVARMP